MSRLVALALALAACSPAAPSSPGASASQPSTAAPTMAASPTVRPAGRLGVLLARSASDITTYRVLLVDAYGRTVASASAPLPSVTGWHLPLASTSASRVYYADGNNAIRSLDPSGNTAVVRTLTAGTSARTVFAVSPDDTQIALATFRYAPPPPGSVVGGPSAVAYEGVRVEPLGGGATTQLRPGIPELRTDAAFPVGWLEGGLLLGFGPAYVQQMVYLTPTSAQSYEVVDPTTGAKRAEIAPRECSLTGPAVRGGTACMPVAGAVLVRYDWRGSKAAEFRSERMLQAPAALSPSGARVAVATSPAGELVLLTPSSQSGTSVTGRPIGWLDDDHVVFAEADGSVGIFDVVTGAAAHTGEPVWAGAFGSTFFATLPSELR